MNVNLEFSKEAALVSLPDEVRMIKMESENEIFPSMGQEEDFIKIP